MWRKASDCSHGRWFATLPHGIRRRTSLVLPQSRLSSRVAGPRAGASLNRSAGRRVYSFPESATFAKRLARCLGTRFIPIGLHSFPDGESLVRVPPGVTKHAIVVRSLDDPNAKLVEILLAADAL